jgi:hypothetical protein
VAEVYKSVNGSPVEKAILIMLCASIHISKNKNKQYKIKITVKYLQYNISAINKTHSSISNHQSEYKTS